MSCGIGCRCGLDPALLWLWCRPAAIAPIGLLAWEPPYAAEVALEKAKRQKKMKIEKQNKIKCNHSDTVVRHIQSDTRVGSSHFNRMPTHLQKLCCALLF